MEAKFKFGDKVKIVDRRDSKNWHPSKTKYIGDVQTIEYVCGSEDNRLYTTKESLYFWLESELELEESSNLFGCYIDYFEIRAALLKLEQDNKFHKEYNQGMYDSLIAIHNLSYYGVDKDGKLKLVT